METEADAARAKELMLDQSNFTLLEESSILLILTANSCG